VELDIEASELVPGDIILLAAGDGVGADARLLEATALEAAEAAETPKTPLELRIAQFGRYLVAAAIALFVAVMAFGLLRGMDTVA
jgi:magnesium-transporting ATPase (P-type)